MFYPTDSTDAQELCIQQKRCMKDEKVFRTKDLPKGKKEEKRLLNVWAACVRVSVGVNYIRVHRFCTRRVVEYTSLLRIFLFFFL